ncbi:hypothetical protein VitviT2T_022695 [Vitis vinifera]|uniref:tRNA/rRNA methyltransferase SpoU type domain-containing protein n=2 Tax=Vitis vinifera TaxID=29760 RepID=A0ABY9DAM3_VITVI|nr:uncharacterized protein LOC100259259 [Vitis vinifera]WKA04683.1 hypothetical protein VitviT2T_022695 [Vitis vinifera]|eukprot:XP_010661108.1 PREDICTED: uncharacterized protein LOC100259259 [Vitis vinifera]
MSSRGCQKSNLSANPKPSLLYGMSAMSACKTLVRISISSLEFSLVCNQRNFSFIPLPNHPSFSPISSSLRFASLLSPASSISLGLTRHKLHSRPYVHVAESVGVETTDLEDDSNKDIVEHLLTNTDDVGRLMKMERRSMTGDGGELIQSKRWFPYLDKFKTGTTFLSSSEILEAMDPYIMEVRKERFRNVVKSRSYSVCLVVEGLCDFGNVSAAFRSADALGFQSVHVVSCDSSKRYKDNRHVSMGAEKWLDIELWNSTQECFEVLKSRGYRIATTHVGMDAVSIYDMDWTCPTAIVVGNENRGISDEALELSDLHCSIPMKGMVDSFNVSVAAGILMHHAVCDRTSRLGSHGDLSLEESRILLAEFSLRHSKSANSIAHEFAKRKAASPVSKL